MNKHRTSKLSSGIAQKQTKQTVNRTNNNIPPRIIIHIGLIKCNREPKHCETPLNEKNNTNNFDRKISGKMINHNFANKNAKNNKTRRKLVSTPSYHVQTLSTNKKCNKKSKKAPQTPNKPATTHLGRKVRNLKSVKENW